MSRAIGSLSIRAFNSNAGNVFVGDSSVTPETGFALSPGERVSFQVQNTEHLYVYGSNTGDSVSYLFPRMYDEEDHRSG